MAVTARFQADFQSFHAAVSKAEAQLVDFSKGAGKVENALNRMTDQFSGRKVIQEAIVMEQAIATLGGTSALTGTQLQQAGLKANEALELMRKRGLMVPPGLQDIADKANTVNRSMSGMLGSVSKIAGAFGIAFSVGAVVGFAKSVLASADALVKMSDKTGIGIQGLQRFQVAGDDAGNSIEEMASAINQMQNRMASNDPSFLNAMKALKINADDFRRLKPEDQFIAMSDALRQIDDPARQVALAMDVFGRQGASVLPTLKRGFDDVRDAAVGMSEETARKLDDLGDSIGRWARKTKGLAAEVAVALIEATAIGQHVAQAREIEKTIKTMEKMRDTAKALAQPGGLKLIDVPSAGELARYEKEIEAAIRATRDAGKAAKDASEKGFAPLRAQLKAIEDATPPTTFKVLSFRDALNTIGTTAPKIRQLGLEIDDLGPVIGGARLETVAFARGVETLPPAFRATTVSIQQLLDEDLEAKLEDSARQIHNVVGALDVVGSALDQVGAKWADVAAEAVQAGAQMVAALASGNYFAAAASVISSSGNIRRAIQAQIQTIEDFKAEVQDFIDMSGGLDKLAERARRAGQSIDGILNIQSVQAYRKEVEKLQEAFQFQNDALSELADTEEKYHLSLDKASASIFREYQTLTAAGHAADTVLRAMQGSWQALIDDARKYGTAVPESMRAGIEWLIQNGLIIDENGVKLTDLAGINFKPMGDSAVDTFKRMTEGVDKLVAVIKLSLHLELTQIEKDLLGIAENIRNLPAIPRFGGGIGTGASAPHSASASNILTPQAVSRLSAASVGGGREVASGPQKPIIVQLYLDGRQITEVVVPLIPGVLDSYGLRRVA